MQGTPLNNNQPKNYPMNKYLIAVLLASTAFISGCAPIISGAMNATVDENTVYEKTAKYFSTERENISISSIEKGALSTTYQAKVAGKAYTCTIYYGGVSCGQAGAPGASGQPSETIVSNDAKPANNEISMTPTQAQVRLNQLGYPVGVADGVFGKRSTEKLKLFQKSRGLAVTGELDAPTVEALRSR